MIGSGGAEGAALFVSDCMLPPAMVTVRYVSRLVEQRALRILLIGLGWIFVGIGFIGVALPLVPTTGPILLAAFLFSISSARFDSWLSEHRVFGPIVQDCGPGGGSRSGSRSPPSPPSR